MKKTRYKRFAFCFLVTMFVFWSGCVVISQLGTPQRHEREIAAEYDLTEHTDKRILVLVSQPVWLNAQVNMRYYLTNELNRNLIKKVGVPSKNVVAYDELSRFRSGRDVFSLLSPVEVGAALDADMVLFVTVNRYELEEIAEMSYYKGLLSVRSVLRDVATGERLWPESAGGKSVRVGFEVESRGREVAVARLASASAHCTVRCLYDCPADKFKVADDQSDIGW